MKILGLEFGLGSFGDMTSTSVTLICVAGDGNEIDIPLLCFGVLFFIVYFGTQLLLAAGVV